jgi:hypothetical protein
MSGRDNAEPDLHNIAGNEAGGRRRAPFSVAQKRRLRRQPLLQRGERIGGLAILPGFERGVEEQQSEDDGEITPMADDRRDERRRLDHIGHGSREIAKNFPQ